MNQYINDFITYLTQVKQVSANTVFAYENDLKKLQTYLDHQMIDSVTRLSETALNSYVLSMEKEGLSPATVSRSISSIKAFFLFLLKQGVITVDPSERIKAPKVQKKPLHMIDTQLMDKLLMQPDLNTKKGIRDKAMLELLYATGMKVSELVHLKVSDINMSGKYVTCNDKRERNIPFGRTAKGALENYLNIREKSFNKHSNDYLFLNSSGEPLSRQGFWKILKSYAKDVGIEDINPNLIRHCFAIHMFRNGADLVSVSEFLGHSDVAATQAYLPQNHQSTREVYMKTHPRA